MTETAAVGILIVAVAGLVTGGGGWPIKLMRSLKFEHWAFVGNLVALVVVPWIIVLTRCPHAFDAYAEIWRRDPSVLVKSNLFSLAWGIANLLCMLCFVRIGFALTNGILTGLGVSVGTTLPMIFKGTGVFRDAPGVGSHAGEAVLAAVAVMIVGVVWASLAGFGRERALKESGRKPGGSLDNPAGFASGLVMVVLAGVLSSGIGLSFVYSQGPIVAAMEARGASMFAANYAVWAVGLLGGALLNILYPAYLMTRNRTWFVLRHNARELGLAVFMGLEASVSIPLMGFGMLKLGRLGASVGLGIQQAMQMTGGQLVGFISGEWRGVNKRPRRQMYVAIGCLLIAILVLSYANTLAKN